MESILVWIRRETIQMKRAYSFSQDELNKCAREEKHLFYLNLTNQRQFSPKKNQKSKIKKQKTKKKNK